MTRFTVSFFLSYLLSWFLYSLFHLGEICDESVRATPAAPLSGRLFFVGIPLFALVRSCLSVTEIRSRNERRNVNRSESELPSPSLFACYKQWFRQICKKSLEISSGPSTSTITKRRNVLRNVANSVSHLRNIAIEGQRKREGGRRCLLCSRNAKPFDLPSSISRSSFSARAIDITYACISVSRSES